MPVSSPMEPDSSNFLTSLERRLEATASRVEVLTTEITASKRAHNVERAAFLIALLLAIASFGYLDWRRIPKAVEDATSTAVKDATVAATAAATAEAKERAVVIAEQAVREAARTAAASAFPEAYREELGRGLVHAEKLGIALAEADLQAKESGRRLDAAIKKVDDFLAHQRFVSYDEPILIGTQMPGGENVVIGRNDERTITADRAMYKPQTVEDYDRLRSNSRIVFRIRPTRMPPSNAAVEVSATESR